MKKKIIKNRIIITAMLIIGFTGIILLTYDYINSKIRLTFETINLEINGNEQPEIINKDSEKEKEIIKKNQEDNNQNTNTNINTNKNTNTNIYKNKDYFGYIEIPKINLTQGLVKLDSRNNKVDRNIQTINPSDYPDVDKGNLILAAHSGSSSIAYFKHLYKLTNNDIVNIIYNNEKYIYNIVNIYTVPKNGQVAIYRNLDKTTLTLITCTKNDDTTQTVYIAELMSKEGV